MLCVMKCPQGHSRGNLTSHAAEQHGGSSLFLTNSTARLIAIQRNNISILSSLYLDQFGVEFSLKDDKNRDWKDYSLDTTTLRRFFLSMTSNTLAQEIVYEQLRTNTIYMTNVY